MDAFSGNSGRAKQTRRESPNDLLEPRAYTPSIHSLMTLRQIMAITAIITILQVYFANYCGGACPASRELQQREAANVEVFHSTFPQPNSELLLVEACGTSADWLLTLCSLTEVILGLRADRSMTQRRRQPSGYQTNATQTSRK